MSRLASFAGVFGRGKGSPPPAGVISQLHSLLFKPTSGLVHTSQLYSRSRCLDTSPPVDTSPSTRDIRATMGKGDLRVQTHDLSSPQPGAKKGVRFWLIFVSICVSVFLSAFEFVSLQIVRVLCAAN